MENLKFEFTIDETNIILAGLSELQAKPPVIELILRIKREAEDSLQKI